jgi:hypothetical protein
MPSVFLIAGRKPGHSRHAIVVDKTMIMLNNACHISASTLPTFGSAIGASLISLKVSIVLL